MKKVLKGIFIPIVILCVITIFAVFACDIYISATAGKNIVGQKSVTDADCILVLGAAVNPDGSVSHALRSRLETALGLYDDGASDKIIVSGDNGTKTYNEVEVMKKYLMERGIPEENIFMDHAGFDTYSSVYRAKEIFCAQKPVIVSQREHLLRAMYFADRLGLDAKGVACLDYIGNEASYQRIREYGARFKAILVCDVFHAKPKYLGEKIPVTGDGRQTNP